MPYAVDFDTVSTVGLESSPAATALAGLRANEDRYFRNKYGHVFTVEPASNAASTIDWVNPSSRRKAAWLATDGLRPGETLETDPARRPGVVIFDHRSGSVDGETQERVADVLALVVRAVVVQVVAVVGVIVVLIPEEERASGGERICIADQEAEFRQAARDAGQEHGAV